MAVAKRGNTLADVPLVALIAWVLGGGAGFAGT